MDTQLLNNIASIKAKANKNINLSLPDRHEEEKLKDGISRRKARNWLQSCLLALLSFEVLFIAYLIISQAIGRLLFSVQPFHLNSWDFSPFINVALVQTCILIRPIAVNLFPRH